MTFGDVLCGNEHLSCSVSGESNERVGGFDKLSTLKKISFFMNPSLLSWKFISWF